MLKSSDTVPLLWFHPDGTTTNAAADMAPDPVSIHPQMPIEVVYGLSSWWTGPNDTSESSEMAIRNRWFRKYLLN